MMAEFSRLRWIECYTLDAGSIREREIFLSVSLSVVSTFIDRSSLVVSIAHCLLLAVSHSQTKSIKEVILMTS